MADLRGQQLKDSYQDVVTDSGSDGAGIENGNGIDITGRIVERGSNSDGEWVRFADGTQILRAELTLSGLTSSNEADDWTLPKSFINTDYIYDAKMTNPSFGEGVKLVYPWPSSNQTLISCRFRTTSDVSSKKLFLTAEGRWK